MRRPGAGHHPGGRTGGGGARGSPGSGGGRAAGTGGGLASKRTTAGRPLPQPGGQGGAPRPSGGGQASRAASLGPPRPARFSWSGHGGPGGRRSALGSCRCARPAAWPRRLHVGPWELPRGRRRVPFTEEGRSPLPGTPDGAGSRPQAEGTSFHKVAFKDLTE